MEEIFGFIGVGRMGNPMATRLLNDKRKVCVFDSDAKAIAAMVALGATKAASAAEVANIAQTVFLSLPNPEIVQAVALGKGGVIEGAQVKRVVDFSTIGPRTAGVLAKALGARDIAYVDAPVSGGLAGARNGKLAVMVSCPKSVFAGLESILKTFGSVFHLGEGAGQ